MEVVIILSLGMMGLFAWAWRVTSQQRDRAIINNFELRDKLKVLESSKRSTEVRSYL